MKIITFDRAVPKSLIAFMKENDVKAILSHAELWGEDISFLARDVMGGR